MKSLKIKIILWFVLGISLAGAGIWVVYDSFQQLLAAVQVLTAPDKAYEAADQIRTDLVITENSMRAYLMSGDNEELDTYLEGMDRIELYLDTLPQIQVKGMDDDDIDEIVTLLQTRADLMYDLVELKTDQREQSLAAKTLGQFQDQLAARNRQARDQPSTIQTDSVPGLKASNASQPADEEKEKKRLLNLFSKKSREKDNTTVQADSIAESVPEETQKTRLSATGLQYSSDLDMEQVRKILRDMGREEAVSNALLDERELEILASDRQLMEKVNAIMDRIEKRNAEYQAAVINQANQQVTDTSVQLFRAVIGAILAGLILLTVLMIDINRMHRYRTQLEESRDYAQRLATARQRFLASMSHEIRTPLNAIIGFSEQLQQNGTSETKEQADFIHSASGHLLEIVNDILDYSKLEFGKASLHQAPFTMQEVLDEVHGILKAKAEEKQLTWSLELDNGCRKWVEGDALRLKQVLINLAGNAIKFTSSGSVTIKVGTVERDRFTDFRILVIDTGIGIDKNAQARIFDDFSQADSSTSRSYGGTGLGLAICKKIIEQHHGTIRVESEPGSGTTFIVELSYRNTKEAATEKKTSRAGRMELKGMKILVADDELFNIRLATMVLEKAGATVTSCQQSDDMESCLRVRYDAYLIDLHMPGRDGVSVAHAIRTKHPDARIIALTADVVTPVAELRQDGLFNDVLHKPYKEQDLLDMLAGNSSAEQKPQEEANQLSMQQHYSLDEIKMFCGSDQKMLWEIVTTFLESAPEQISMLQEALENKDDEGVRNAAHKMLPAFQHFHMQEAVPLLKDLELLGLQANHARPDQYVHAVRQAALQVFRELKREMEMAGVFE